MGTPTYYSIRIPELYLDIKIRLRVIIFCMHNGTVAWLIIISGLALSKVLCLIKL